MSGGAAGLEHGTVPRMLRQQGPLGLAPRLEAEAGTTGIREQLHFHVNSNYGIDELTNLRIDESIFGWRDAMGQ